MNAEKKNNELSLRDIEILFRPFRSRKLELPTRIVMAPMTRGFCPDGIPDENVAAYYKSRAEHEVGLIITEGTFVEEASASHSVNCPNFFGGKSLRGWKKVAEAVHTTNCRIMPQLWHTGMARPLAGEIPNPQSLPIGPSGIDLKTLRPICEPMSHAKIHEVTEVFGRAAHSAKKLKFDGVEIHGAHGYLIDQFLWKETNRRTDEYGGGIYERTRFAREVILSVRRAVGQKFPIVFRFSQWKMNHYDARLADSPAELEELLLPLSEAGVDVFHCSTRRFWEPAFKGSPLTLAGWTRKLTGKPVIAVGSVGLDRMFGEAFLPDGNDPHADSLEPLVRRMQANEFDLIAVGRSLLADPEWASKIHEGREDEVRIFSKSDLQTL